MTDLFVGAGVPYAGVARWHEPVMLHAPGVYVISTSADPDRQEGLRSCPLDLTAVSALLNARHEATVDSVAATPDLLTSRLRAMWPKGEPVVYIGLAGSSTHHRVDQFYKTAIGARAPHAGGWPVKMLDPELLWVHYGPTQDPATAEAAMIGHFVANISDDVASTMIDPTAPLPFANLTFPAGRRKAHGLHGFKAPRQLSDGEGRATPHARELTQRADLTITQPPESTGITRPTQNVTATDISNGQLRVPRLSKSIFPAIRAEIEVELRGDIYAASWDPRTDGDKERSGVIRIGRRILSNYIQAGVPRQIETTRTGYRIG